MFKNLIMSFIYFMVIIIVSNIFITIFNYFDIINIKIINTLKIIVPVLGIFISSYILGAKSSKLGYIEGIKLGVVVIIIFIVISFICKSFIVRSLIYYFILLLSSALGGMLGINFKKKSYN